MFTAALMICLVGQPRVISNCHIINAQYKFKTEEQCWQVLNDQVKNKSNYRGMDGFEVAYAKCFDWLPMSESGV